MVKLEWNSSKVRKKIRLKSKGSFRVSSYFSLHDKAEEMRAKVDTMWTVSGAFRV